MDMRKLKEEQLYEFFKSLNFKDQAQALEEIINNVDESKEDPTFLQNLDNVKKRIEEDIKYREIFYWQLYGLIDKNKDLTDLGLFYAFIYTNHYIKALKLLTSFSKNTLDKNKILYTNEKANEFLDYFKLYIKKSGLEKTKHII